MKRTSNLNLPLYENPATITKVSIYASELNNFFKGNKLVGVEYWKAIPLKVVLHNFDRAIIEQGFILHDNGLGFSPEYGFYSWLVKRTDLVTSPSNFRTISSISYDSVNRKYDINFGGTTNTLGSITIQPL